ncbi:outer membrane beta-barrel family protein [Capnocytophaga sp.]|uniref:outer membrane beta-barrel family protein n=1 Tax=Capnocytophaga sp. TaxID=44737 RepID=UPI0026DC2837|nr:outer membrane beta-barrel family protein [Capnocytophaga sp.]MDO5106242.1 outer membrane beta-barrel family protein [Capnocytophaga sp.]
MKNFITLTTFLFCLVGFGQNTLRGKLVDAAARQIVSNANVILVSLPDSTLVKGAISDDNGVFELVSPSSNANLALKILHLEYKTQILSVKTTDFGTILLEKSLNELGEVVVSVSRPIMKQKGTTVITDIATSSLKELPQMEMLLNFLPGVSTSYTGEGYTVFGKKNPIFYINKRRVYNLDELSRIAPKDIESIELETQPGAEYDNNIGAVIRIKLKKKQGDGLSGNIYATYNLRKGMREEMALNLNYRKGKTDVFGSFDSDFKQAMRSDSWQEIDVQTPATKWKVRTDDTQKNNGKSINGKLGVNHEFNEKHSLGAVAWAYVSPFAGHTFTDQQTQTFRNAQLSEKGQNHYDRFNQNKKWEVNAYYEGQLSDKLKLHTDFDYSVSSSDNNSNIFERNLLTNSEKNIRTHSDARANWLHAKTTLSQSLGKTAVSYGAEFSTLSRFENYTDNVLTTSFVDNKELRSSGFLSVSRAVGKANLKAGVRYEYADFEYFQNQVKDDVKSRTYTHWLPNVTLAFPWNKTQMSVSYARKIRRPAFYELSDYSAYESSFLYNRGNPNLRPRLADEFTILATYKIVSASLAYSFIKDAYYEDYRLFDANPNVVERSMRNYDAFQTLKLVLSAQHKIGKWVPKLDFTFGKQFAQNVFYTNQPVFAVEMMNQFLLSDDWLGLFYVNYQSKGSVAVTYSEKGVMFSGVAIARTFFNKSLQVYAVAEDIFGTSNAIVRVQNPFVTNRKFTDGNNRGFKIGLQYTFNPTQNKYKGKSINEDEKERL